MTISDIPTPTTRANEVLVRVHAASVNAGDWIMLKPIPRLFARFLGEGQSAAIGRDYSGVVERVGASVTTLRVGDAVFGSAAGAFAEHVAAREARLAVKPDAIGFDAAAALPTAGCTALQAIRDVARVARGDRVLIYGAGGGVGSMAVQIAKAFGAHVTAATRREHLDAVHALGADVVIDYTVSDPLDGAAPYHAMIDMGASRPAAERARGLMPGARVVQLGPPLGIAKQLKATFREGRVRDAPKAKAFLARVNATDLAALARLCEEGQLDPLVERTCALEAAPDAVREMGTRRARGKTVISMTAALAAP